MIDQIVECIISRPQEFTLAGRTFAIYPESLGVSLLLVCHYKRLGLRNDGRVAASMEALMLCKQQRNEVAEIIALSTASGKDEALDPQWMQERAKFLTKHLSDDEMAALLIVILSMPRAVALIKDIGLDREQEEKRRIAKASGDNSVSFGGRSLYGALIDAACERYGWTFDYVVWGISLVNLRMMLADAIASMYVSDETRKKAHIQPRGEEFISAENTDIDTLRKMTEG